MKNSLTGIDIRALLFENRRLIEGSWVNNIYQLPNNIFLLKIRIPGISGSHFLLLEPEKRFHFTNYSRPVPKQPPKMCMTLRKHLRDKRINKITQDGLERVIELEIGPEPSYKLILELFPRGALILVSPENKIIVASSYRKMRDRDIHPGREYRPPPISPDNLLNLSIEKIHDTILNSKEKIGLLLNKLLNVGPLWSKEILKRASVKNRVSSELSEEEIMRLLKVIEELQIKIIDNAYEPTVIVEENNDVTRESINHVLENESSSHANASFSSTSSISEETLKDLDFHRLKKMFSPENVVEIAPFPLSLYDDLKQIQVSSLNEAIDYFFSSQEEDYDVEGEIEVVISKKTGLEKRLEDQIRHYELQKKISEESRKNAELIYSYFNELNELFHAINTAIDKKVPWDEVKNKLTIAKQKGVKSAQIFKDIRPSSAKVVVELKSEDGDTKELSLDFRKTITEIAEDFYKDAKKAEKKLVGAKKAIEETKKKIEDARRKGKELEKKAVMPAVVVRRKKKWYEKFLWFFTSEGLLVIGGTDAATNEKIVKRYLDDSDLYFHADIHGAPSVVLKEGKEKASEESIRQAANLAVAYSSAWKAKVSSGDAYYVNPDQVSFTPPSGQYLSKGAVMIYGEKTYVKHLPVRTAIGLIVRENWVEIIGGPLEAIKEQTQTYVILEPGENPPGSTAKQILGIFKKAVPENEQFKFKALDINEIIKFIPGDSKIVKNSISS